MSSKRYTPEFKEEAVRQVVDRGYSVTEVAERLDVSAHSLYKWIKAIKPDNTEQQAQVLIEAKSEILKLKAQLRRTEEAGRVRALSFRMIFSSSTTRRWCGVIVSRRPEPVLGACRLCLAQRSASISISDLFMQAPLML